MGMNAKLFFPIVVISVLLACGPTEAWYKQVAGPSYYSVGRASGLLSGIRRSPYVRRAELDSSDSVDSATNSVFSDFTPHNFILQSCELFQETKGSFKCKADVFLSLDSSDCAGD